MKLSLTTLLVIIFASVFSQTSAFRQYTPRNSGLPQMQVMNTYLAPDGALWVCTYGGVGRFNGKRFTNYSVREGLSSNIVSDIMVVNDTVWVANRDGLDYIYHDSVSLWAEAYPEKFYSAGIFLYQDNFYLHGIQPNRSFQRFDYSSLFDIRQKKIINSVSLGNGKMQFHSVYPFKDSLLVLTKQGILKTSYKNLESTLLPLKFDESILAIEERNGLPLLTLGDSSNGTVIFSKLIQLDTADFTKILFSLDNDYKKDFLKNNFLFQTKYKEFVVFDNITSDLYLMTETKMELLKKLESIINDALCQPFSYWIGTDNGLWKIKISGFEYYNPDDGFPRDVWSAIPDKTGKIWFASFQNGLYLFDKKKIIAHYKPEIALYYNGAVHGFKSDVLFPHHFGITAAISNGKKFSELKTDYPTLTLSRDETRKIILAGSMQHLMTIDTNYQVKEIFDVQSLGINYTILSIEHQENRYLLGLGRGMVEFIPETGKARILITDNIRTSDLITDSTGAIWAATSRGLMKFRNDSLIPVFPEYIREEVLTLEISNDNRLFIAGARALYTLDLGRYHSKRPHCMLTYHLSAGYESGEPGQNSFYKDENGILWLPTSDNVVKIDPSLISVPAYLPQATFVRGYAVNAEQSDSLRIVKNMQIIILPYDLNNLYLEFEAIQLDFPESLRFQYFMEGVTEHWVDLQDETKLTFGNLGPGKYTLRVRATLSETFDEVPEAVLKIVIHPPVWLSWWFISLIILIVISGVYQLLRFFLRQEQRRSQQLLELHRLRGQALGMQMDNHFLVNCTTKIAMLSQEGKLNEASVYATRFVRFLQRNLRSLRQDFITLQEELDLAQAYTRLEQTALISFDLTISISDKIDPNAIWIPPFLIQPIVENSIKHGIKQRNKPGGLINITIEQLGSYLVIAINDNGPGIKLNNSLQGNQVSLKIIEDRLRLMGKSSRMESAHSEAGFKTTLYIYSEIL